MTLSRIQINMKWICNLEKECNSTSAGRQIPLFSCLFTIEVQSFRKENEKFLPKRDINRSKFQYNREFEAWQHTNLARRIIIRIYNQPLPLQYAVTAVKYVVSHSKL